MSDQVLAPVVTVSILAAMFLWVPTLHICNDRCRRLLLRRPEKTELAAREEASASEVTEAA